MGNFTNCDLHIPHKEWAGDPRELENYAALERWALNFRTNCLPTTGFAINGIITQSSSATTVASATDTLITQTSVYSSGTDVTFDGASTFTVHHDGVYRIEGGLSWVSNAAGNIRRVTMVLAGNNSIASGPPLAGGFPTSVDFSTFFQFSSGATISLKGFQDSGGNLNANGQASVFRII